MTQSTFSAQVANKCLTILHGYSKTIRLLLVMFLTLTVSANAWGESVTLSNGEFADSKITWTAANGNITITQSKGSGSTAVSNSYVSAPRVYKGHILSFEAKDGYKIKQINIKCSSTYYGNSMTAGTVINGTTVTNNTAEVNRSWATSSGGTHVVSSVSSDGLSAIHIQNVATTNVQLRFTAIEITYVEGVSTPTTQHTIKWHTAVGVTTDMTLEEGATITKPATDPTMTGYEFMGWTASCDVVSDGSDFTALTDFGTADSDKDFYAVFAVATTTSGGGSSNYEKVTSNLADWAGDYLIAYNNTTFADGRIGGTGTNAMGASGVKVDLSSSISNNTIPASVGDQYNVTLEAVSGGYVLKTKDGKYNYQSSNSNGLAATTNISTATTYAITVTFTSENDIKLALSGSAKGAVFRYNTSGYFRFYKNGGQSAVYLYKKGAGGSTTTYSGYITTCAAGDPCDALQAPNVTATATANSITLSWAAVDGATSYNIYNYTTEDLDETTSLTYTFTGLSSETEYEWGVESAKDECFKETRGTTTTLEEAPTNYTVTLNPNYPAGKTGTFKDKEGNTVNGNLVISLPEGTKTQPIADLYSSISLDGYIFEGWFEVTAEGEKHRENTGTITNDTTFYAHWKEPYTVTFNAGTGTCTGSITETTANGITLPTATLEDCGNWVFLGWAENAIASETTTAPASILYGGSTYKPTDDITLYAIYKRAEGGGNGEGTAATLTFDNTSKRTTLTTEQQVWTENGITLTNNKASSTSNVADYSNPARFYAKSEIIISAPANINKIVANCSKGASDLVSSVGAEACNSNNAVTIFPTSSNTTFTIAQLSAQVQMSSITVTYGGGLSTSYYHSKPVCQTCENILTISKGAETNGTFTLDISGDIETCETEVSVVVKPTPANHYHIGSVTATTPTTGGAPNVIDNDNGTYTITYAANSTGTSTINVTFAEDAKATIKLYELGVLTTIATEYVGDKYTLPSNSSQSCGTKTLVGWSTKAFAETDTRPTENYYGISTQITLAETQTFYAVFAQSNGGGGGNGDYARVIEALDDWSGDYLIAYNDQTFANGSIGGTSGMGAEGNKQNLSSHIKNNTISANIGDLYNVTLVTVDGGYVLQTKDNKYNYQSSNANGLAVTDNIETAKKYPLTVTFNNENDIAIAHSHGAIFHYNKNQAGYFRFYKDGGQESVYLYKKSGTAATYTGYTTSCAVITGIEVDNPKTDFKQYDEFVFGGTVYAVDENDNRIDVTSSATFSGYDMKKAGTDTVTVTYLTHSTTYEITIEKVNAYALTWNVSGATNTGLAPAYVIPGNAIGKLPTPKEIPAGCEGKTFVGWTESNVVNEDGTDITFIKSTTVPSQATTYYAVFARPSGIAGDGDYVKVIEDANDLSGEYLIVYEAGNLAFNGGLTTLDAVSNTIAVTISSNTIASADATDAAKFTIAKDGEGDYTIKSTSGKYIGKTANDNDLEESESTPYKNTITFTDGNVNIIASGGAYLRYNKNSGAERFRYYKSTTYTQQQPIALYKKSGSSASYTDYTTGCHDVTITYYGFKGGYTDLCDGSDLNVITQRVNSSHTIPTCTEIIDPTDLGRTFLNLWKDQNGKEHKPGDSFIVTQDITLYAQWALNTSDNTTLPTDVEDLATTDVVVTGGTTLTLQAGTTTINSLTLKGGLQENGTYAMPVVNIPEGATLVRNNNKINLDLKVNNKSYYPFAVPFEVANTAANVNYINTTLKDYANKHDGYGKYYRILEYDGAKRAEKGLNNDSNWVHVGRTDVKLMPGKGYAISAVPAAGDDTVTIRITMTVDNAWLANGEQKSITVKEQTTTRNQIAVTAHTGAAADKDLCNAGWNFVANPYLTNFTTYNHITGVDYIGGEIIVSNGQFVKDGTEVPYVTIPNANMSWYEQRRVEDAILSPMYSFFVQIAKGGTMTFTTAGRQQAPAALRASSEQANPSFEADIVILNNQEQVADHTGLVINDRWTPAYEIGGDLEKMFGTANRTAIYTLSGNTRLAYNALSYNDALVAIPVGFRAQANGEYTIQLRNTEDIEDVESIELKDLYNNQTTNLLYNDYTFYSDATQEDSRFVVYLVPKKNTTTDISTITNGNTENRKIIFNNHLYIIHNGNIYNGTGQMVK